MFPISDQLVSGQGETQVKPILICWGGGIIFFTNNYFFPWKFDLSSSPTI